MINIIEWSEIDNLERNESYHKWIKETLQKDRLCKVQILKQGILIDAPTRKQLISMAVFIGFAEGQAHNGR